MQKFSIKYSQKKFKISSKRSFSLNNYRLHSRDREMVKQCKSTNVVHHIYELKDRNDTITSIDAEKTYDNINHPSWQKSWDAGSISQGCREHTSL